MKKKNAITILLLGITFAIHQFYKRFKSDLSYVIVYLKHQQQVTTQDYTYINDKALRLVENCFKSLSI